MEKKVFNRILPRTASPVGTLASVLMLAALALTSCGGGDDDSPATPENVYIRFSLSNVDNVATRAAQGEEDVTTYVMSATDGSTYLLSVSETDGIPETTDEAGALTRGLPVESAGAMSDFSTYCYYEDGSAYYENIASGNNGQLREQKIWPQGKPLRFYAVYPYDAAKANFASSPTSFSYTYNVSTDVTRQADLMYASTGLVPFNTDGLARLHFHHALAPVRVKVVSVNSSVARINSVTFKNVRSRGTLTLPASDGTATWTLDNGTEYVKDFSVTGLNITNPAQGTVLNPGEKTFLMIPQSVDNVTLEISVTLSDGTTHIIPQSLAGKNAWTAKTVSTYEVSLH